MQRDAQSHPLRFLTVALCALAPSLILPACGSTPNSRFYVLTPADRSPSGDTPTMKVGVQRVILPASVDRSQMLMSLSANQRSISELDRWAGSLGEDMKRVIGQNLEARLGATSVYQYPTLFALPTLDYIVIIEVLELQATPDGNCRLIAKFHVTDGSNHWITSRHVDINTADTEGRSEGAAGVAESLSTSLDDLSGMIAATLQQTASSAGTDEN